MILSYPACFYKDGDRDVYAGEVPDLPGCVSGGETWARALAMVIDAACGWIHTEWEEGKSAPPASDITDICADASEPNGFVRMIELDMDAYCAKYGYAMPKLPAAV